MTQQRQPPRDNFARLSGRVGGLSTWVGDPEGAAARLAEARRKLDARFTTEQERKLYFTRMALKSAQARAAKKKKRRASDEETAPEYRAALRSVPREEADA